jgi:hypothetical protein
MKEIFTSGLSKLIEAHHKQEIKIPVFFDKTVPG